MSELPGHSEPISWGRARLIAHGLLYNHQNSNRSYQTGGGYEKMGLEHQSLELE